MQGLLAGPHRRFNVVEQGFFQLWFEQQPPALQAVRAAHHLELLLRSGFTGAVSAGAPFAIDASMKAAIDRGLVQGPRLVPCSRDISTTGHAGDRSFPTHWEIGALGAIRRSDGADEFRRAVRLEVKEGAEMIKVSSQREYDDAKVRIFVPLEASIVFPVSGDAADLRKASATSTAI